MYVVPIFNNSKRTGRWHVVIGWHGGSFLNLVELYVANQLDNEYKVEFIVLNKSAKSGIYSTRTGKRIR